MKTKEAMSLQTQKDCGFRCKVLVAVRKMAGKRIFLRGAAVVFFYGSLTACSSLPGLSDLPSLTEISSLAGGGKHALDDPNTFLQYVNETVMDKQQLPSNGRAKGTVVLAALPQAPRYKLALDDGKRAKKSRVKMSAVRPTPVAPSQLQSNNAQNVAIVNAVQPSGAVLANTTMQTLAQPVNVVRQTILPVEKVVAISTAPTAQRYSQPQVVQVQPVPARPTNRSIALPKIADRVAAEVRKARPVTRKANLNVLRKPVRHRPAPKPMRPVSRAQQVFARPAQPRATIRPAIHRPKSKVKIALRTPAKLGVKASGISPEEGLQATDYWKLIVQGYQLTPHLNQTKVKKYVSYYAERPASLRTLRQRAAVYLPEILASIRARRLPTEIALLPFVESGFVPTAVSKAGAVGLWQFIPETGRRYGLMQNADYDGRLHPKAATKAALDYLTDLHRRFDGDWLLAFAAYNSGERRVSRAIAANLRDKRPTDFWSLRLPKETREYIPRLLAFREIIRTANAGR